MKSVCGDATKDYILEVNGGGACWLDYDGDGLLDLYLVNGSTMERWNKGEPGEPNRLFRGRGEGRFEEVAEAAGAADRGWGFGCSVADYDNDGWADLFVANYGPSRLYRNRGDGRFEDVTEAAGVPNPPAGRPPSWGTGSAFADYDGDGLLDLYVCNYLDFDVTDPPVDGKVVAGMPLSCKWEGKQVMCGPLGLVAQHDRLYRNRGDGRFEDVSEPAGIRRGPARQAFAVVPFDYDDDGDVDFYVANDSVDNNLWENDGAGHFEDVAVRAGAAMSEDGRPQGSMGVDAQDYDGDGKLDLFYTNFAKEYNALLRNLGNRLFLDVSFVSGVALPSIPRLGWGTSFIDVENDGDLDLFVVNGHVYPGIGEEGEGGWRQRNQVYINQGGRFTDRSDQAGEAFRERRVGRGAAFADFDRDGGMDVLVTNLDEEPTLYRNTAARGHWLEVDLRGTRSNRDALGSRVTLRTAGGKSLLRDLHGGSSYLSANARRAHFGLGVEERVAVLEVRWPDGSLSEVRDLAAEQIVAVDQDRGLVQGSVAAVRSASR